MKFDPEIHHRRSIRLNGYDYTQTGAYFVTICTFQRDEIFGRLENSKIHLSSLGEIVQTEWFRSGEIRKEIRLIEDEFVVMPNHIHGIVWLVETDTADLGDARPVVERVCPVKHTGAKDSIFFREDTHAEGTRREGTHRVPLHRATRSLSSFIAGYKASVTSRAGRELNAANIWQRNYYEHIIRNDAEFMKIRDYIDTNPVHWLEDQLHPSAPPSHFNQANP